MGKPHHLDSCALDDEGAPVLGARGRTRGSTARRRAAVTLVGVLVTAAVLVGCGARSTGGTQAEDGTTTLVWQAWSGSEVETEALRTVADMVTEAEPDLRIEIRTSTFPDYWTRIAAQAAGGDIGCLVSVQAARATSIGPLLMPLTDERLQGAGIDLTAFEPTIVEALQVDGDQVAVPYDLGPLVVYYDAGAFAEAGLEPPAAGWTVDDFEAAARELTTDDRSGYAIAPLIDTFTAWTLAREGVQGVDDDGRLALNAGPMADTVTWLRGLTQDGTLPTLPATNDTQYALNEFVAGNAAMTVDGPWQLGFVREQAGFEAGIAPMPVDPGGAGAQVNGSGYGVAANCPYPQEALRALAVITGPEALAYLGEAGRAYPARTEQQGSWFAGQPGAEQAQQVVAEALADAQPYRSTVRWTQVNTLFTQYSVQALNGQVTPEEFLETVQQQTQ